MGFKYHTARQRRKIALTFFFDEEDGARLPPFALENEPFFWPPPDAAPLPAFVPVTGAFFFAGVAATPLSRFPPVAGASNANRMWPD